MTSKEIMQLGIDEAAKTMRANVGGPFGAVVVKDGEVISVASNTVLETHDPTAHAEVNAIRQASKALGTHDLSDCEIYATACPCPMCLSSIIWANIKKVHYGCIAKDTADIGFRDDFMYDFFKDSCKDESVVSISNENREECLTLFKDYSEMGGQLY